MDTDTARPLRVDIVSDVVCPWCVIGYLQLMKALDALQSTYEAEINWHPFELNPWMPAEGQELREHLAQKYGPAAGRGGETRKRLTELGSALGFEFDYYEGMRMVNTFRAHRLLYWAAGQGLQTELKLALFRAFFSRRKDVNDPRVLADVCAEVGLDPAEASRVISEERFSDEVRREQEYWRDRDVYAVPTFRFQEQFVVPGAQEPETFVRVLNKVREREVESAI